jgi:hypothetical protein
MKLTFKITTALLQEIRRDLHRPHAFACERVGFISAGLSLAAGDTVLALARAYQPVADDDYLPDCTVGALIGADAIRKALQWSITKGNAVFHVHSHGGMGKPDFSTIDRREHSKFLLDFLKVTPQLAHGALVLSNDSASGVAVFDRSKPCVAVNNFLEIGVPIRRWSGL